MCGLERLQIGLLVLQRRHCLLELYRRSGDHLECQFDLRLQVRNVRVDGGCGRVERLETLGQRCGQALVIAKERVR